MAIRTISTAGGNWNDTLAWSEGVVPTSADDVVSTGTSGPLTINVAADCQTFDMTSYVSTVTHNAGILLSVTSLFRLASGMTYTLGNAATSAIAMVGTGPGGTITSQGKTLGNFTFDGVGGAWELIDDMTLGDTATLTLTNGTFNSAGFNLSIGQFSSSNANTRTLTMGASGWTISGTGTVWNCATTTGMTINSNTSTIKISDGGAAGKTFAGGGLIYNNFTISPSGAGIVTIEGSNTFATFTINTPKTVRFTAATTQTVTSFVAVGNPANTITIDTTVAASAATLSKASGIVSCDYLSLKDSAAIGGATWLAGSNSTNVSGNSGWLFQSDKADDIARGNFGFCISQP